MAGFLYKGILLQQQKEPALSRDLREFFNADTIGLQLESPPVENPDELTPKQIREIACAAKIVDERDGTPLGEKLEELAAHPPRWLVGDAIDDEPYISSQLNPLLKNQKLAADGLRLLQRAVLAHDAYFAVYKNLTDLETKIPKLIGDYPVKRIRGRYPAEYQAANLFEAGSEIAMIGAGAIIHLARAVLYHKPQTTAFITVAGNCIGNPTNLEISLGMTVAQALERCGLIDDPSRVIIGGSMTGISLIDTENTIITPTTRAILAFREDVMDLHLNCIGCSRCVHVCPEGLNPYFLYRSIKLHRFVDFRTLDAQMCIGCGTCSYMCPAKLNLSATILEGQQSFRPMIGSMRAASVTRQKNEAAAFASHMTLWNCEESRRMALRARKAAAKNARTEAARRAESERNAERQAASARQRAEDCHTRGQQQVAQTALQTRTQAAEQAAAQELSLRNTCANALLSLERDYNEKRQKRSSDHTSVQEELSFELAQIQKELSTQRESELRALETAVAQEVHLLEQLLADERKQRTSERDRTVRQLEKDLIALQKQIEREAADLNKHIERDCARDISGFERTRKQAERAIEQAQKAGDQKSESAAERTRQQSCVEIEQRRRLADTEIAKNQSEADTTLLKRQSEFSAQIESCRKQVDEAIAASETRTAQAIAQKKELAERDRVQKEQSIAERLAKAQTSYDERSTKQRQTFEQATAQHEQSYLEAAERTRSENTQAIDALLSQNAVQVAQVNAQADETLAAKQAQLAEELAAEHRRIAQELAESLLAAKQRGEAAEAALEGALEEVRLAGIALAAQRDPAKAARLAADFETEYFTAVLSALPVPSTPDEPDEPFGEPEEPLPQEEPVEPETPFDEPEAPAPEPTDEPIELFGEQDDPDEPTDGPPVTVLGDPNAGGWRKNDESGRMDQ